jgi:hypothetical protein
MRSMAAARGERDANHAELTREYEALGCKVQDLSAVGGGCPDVLVSGSGVKGRWDRLVEFKTETGTLTPSQIRWNGEWRGRPAVLVRTAEQVHQHVKQERLGLESMELREPTTTTGDS